MRTTVPACRQENQATIPDLQLSPKALHGLNPFGYVCCSLFDMVANAYSFSVSKAVVASKQRQPGYEKRFKTRLGYVGRAYLKNK